MASEAAGIIAQGLHIKGSLSGSGDLVIEGCVEGEVALGNHLTVGAGGVLRADARVERLTVHGEAHGRLEAGELIALHAGAKVTGALVAPCVAIDEGAQFTGEVQMDVVLPEGV